MKKLEIQISDSKFRRLERIANQIGKSMDKFTNELINHWLDCYFAKRKRFRPFIEGGDA